MSVSSEQMPWCIKVNEYTFQGTFDSIALLGRVLLAHLSHRLMVSYCHQPMSGVSRPSCVVHRQQLLQTTSPLKPLSLGP